MSAMVDDVPEQLRGKCRGAEERLKLSLRLRRVHDIGCLVAFTTGKKKRWPRLAVAQPANMCVWWE